MAIKGLAEARAKFRALPVEVQVAVRTEMEKIANEMVAGMKAACPRDENDLANSIGWTWGAPPTGSVAMTSVSGGEGTLTVYAGNEVTQVRNSRGVVFQNAKLQEFGTKKMPAHPYFFPVIRAYRGRVTRRINAAAKRAALRAWSK